MSTWHGTWTFKYDKWFALILIAALHVRALMKVNDTLDDPKAASQDDAIFSSERLL